MDLSPYISTIQKADCVIFWFTPPLCQRFVTQYYAAGLKMPLIIGMSTQIMPKQLAQLGDNAIGMIGAANYSILLDTPTNKAYIEAFTKKYDPGLISDQGISTDVSLLLYLEAVKATGGDVTPAKIIDALLKVQVDTPAGKYSFTPEGLGIASQYLTQVVKDGNQYGWKVIDQYSPRPLYLP